MKKIVLALVALMFVAAPAWADVDITCAQIGEPCDGQVLISFDASEEEPSLVRAFGLNIQLDNDSTILEVDDTINADYYIFPGTIQIDALTGEVTSYGTAVGEVSDSPDTLPGLDSNGITVEMASLYAPPGGIGSPNSPDSSGPLLSIYLSRPATDLQTCLTISGNVARAGSNGVVMEDPDEDPTVNAPGCCVDWEPVWPCDTPGQQSGDTNDDCLVNIADLAALKVSWFKSTGQDGYNACADFDRNGMVNIADLAKLKVNWFKNVCP